MRQIGRTRDQLTRAVAAAKLGSEVVYVVHTAALREYAILMLRELFDPAEWRANWAYFGPGRIEVFLPEHSRHLEGRCRGGHPKVIFDHAVP